jgi:hypothetical protein
MCVASPQVYRFSTKLTMYVDRRMNAGMVASNLSRKKYRPTHVVLALFGDQYQSIQTLTDALKRGLCDDMFEHTKNLEISATSDWDLIKVTTQQLWHSL